LAALARSQKAEAVTDPGLRAAFLELAEIFDKVAEALALRHLSLRRLVDRARFPRKHRR
jgi:hypothetical protein